MTPAATDSLENFVERHRADFDVHEPRPDLWAALEAQLDAPKGSQRLGNRLPATGPYLAVAQPEATGNEQLETRNKKRETSSLAWRYGMAAGLAALALAAGLSQSGRTPAAPAETAVATLTAYPPEATDAALYLGSGPQPAANDLGDERQLSAAVRGMETYYLSQLSRREVELRELGDTSVVPGRLTGWQQQLVSLDSSYRLLKRELPHHPQPEVLLTDMNRNLQIRLDILDQQLHLAPAPDATGVANAFVLADSRQAQ